MMLSTTDPGELINRAHVLLIAADVSLIQTVQQALGGDETAEDRRFVVTAATCLAEARPLLEVAFPTLILCADTLADGRWDSLLAFPNLRHSCPVVVILSPAQADQAEALTRGALDYLVQTEAMLAALPALMRSWLREWRQHEAQAHLRKVHEAHFRVMFESASDGILLVRMSGEVLMCNVAAAAMFGYTPMELVGQNVDTLTPEAVRSIHARHRTQYEQVPSKRVMGHGRELLGKHRDGHTFPVEISLSPLVVDNEPLVMCMMADVSMRQLLEEQKHYAQSLEVELQKGRELLELKERFISMVSHEFRTPLSTITLTVETIRSYFGLISKDKMREKLDVIRQQATRMTTLLEEILLLARGNAKRNQLEPEPVKIAVLWHEMLETIRIADNHRHDFILNLNGLPETFISDESRLRHIVLNLLSNAAKYSPEGSEVTCNVAWAGETLTLTVTDHGIGIPQEDQARLFEPFHRARNTQHTQGTGLGLAIVKQSVEALGGAIAIDSAVGQGTCVTVILPALPGHLTAHLTESSH